MPMNFSLPKNQPLADLIRLRYPSEGPQALAAETGMSVSTIRVAAHQLGLVSGVRRQRQQVTKSANNETADINYFDTWSPNMAWLLGYIWADGCVLEKAGKPFAVSFICTESDQEILETVKKELKSSNRITYKPPYASRCKGREVRSKPARMFRINSTVMAGRLFALGIMPRKSYVDPPLPDVPSHLVADFARGVLNGDGTVGIREDRGSAYVQWVGSVAAMTALRNAIASQCVLPLPTLFRNGTLLRFSWTAKRDVIALSKWLYPENCLCLQRKKKAMGKAVAILAGVTPRRSRLT